MSDETTVEQIVRIIRKRHNEWMIGLMVSEDQWTAQLARKIAALHAEAAAEIERLRMAEVERAAAEAQSAAAVAELHHLEAEVARHMDEIDAANNRTRSAKAECAAVAAERDAALARAGRLDSRIATLEAALRFAQEVLEQAMNYIHDETPEVGTFEEARDDTLWKIRDADRAAAAALADATEEGS